MMSTDQIQATVEQYEAGMAMRQVLTQPPQTQEPYMAQRDDTIISRIEKACQVWGWDIVKIGERELPIETMISEKYPELLNLSLGLSPLERTSYLTEDEAIIRQFKDNQITRENKWRFQFNDEALSLLETIQMLRWTVVNGDMKNGMRAKHIQKVSGSSRELNINPSRQRSLFDRLRGR